MKNNLLAGILLCSIFAVAGCASDHHHDNHHRRIGYSIKCSDGTYAGSSGRCSNDPAGSDLTIEVQ